MSFKDRGAELGDLTDGIDEAAGRLEGLLEMALTEDKLTTPLKPLRCNTFMKKNKVLIR